MKIINEAAFYLDDEHIAYLFAQITETPAHKLGMEEFESIAALGRWSRSADLSAKTNEFFWNIITNSNDFKSDLITNVVNKFSDMIKYHSLEKKQAYFDKVTDQLNNSEIAAVPVIRLFTKIIKDQKSLGSYSGASTTASTTSTTSTSGIGLGSGTIIYSKSFTGHGESIYPGNSSSTS